MQTPTPPDSHEPEAWLRGPVAGIPPLLQPVAHALLQALEDAEAVAAGVSRDELWAGVGGAASMGFHLIHATGSLDRLFTYARGESLSDAQREALAMEKAPSTTADAGTLLSALRAQVGRALAQLGATDTATLTDHRAVGRAGAPSTVIGLLFHGAEHTVRHVGQAITTARTRS